MNPHEHELMYRRITALCARFRRAVSCRGGDDDVLLSPRAAYPNSSSAPPTKHPGHLLLHPHGQRTTRRLLQHKHMQPPLGRVLLHVHRLGQQLDQVLPLMLQVHSLSLPQCRSTSEDLVQEDHLHVDSV
ncbi:hypothetical protein SEVIR_6G035401v4 [Setaria viridis]